MKTFLLACLVLIIVIGTNIGVQAERKQKLHGYFDNEGNLDIKKVPKEVFDIQRLRDNMKRDFSLIDFNRDGNLDFVELRKWVQNRGDDSPDDEAYQYLAHYDANRDGRLSQQEYLRAAEEYAKVMLTRPESDFFADVEL